MLSFHTKKGNLWDCKKQSHLTSLQIDNQIPKKKKKLCPSKFNFVSSIKATNFLSMKKYLTLLLYSHIL